MAEILTAERIEAVQNDLETGQIDERLVILRDLLASDLHVYLWGHGRIDFRVNYMFGQEQASLRIGYFPETSIEKAREIATRVTTLARRGIDPIKNL